MTTTAPTWLNLDAFEIPEAAVADLRRTIDELRALVPQMEQLTTRARTALDAIQEAPTDNLPDDVSEALWELTGQTELRDVLFVLAWYAEEITDGCVTEEYREKIRKQRGDLMADLEQWTWRSLSTGHRRTGALWLYWEPDLSSMSKEEDGTAVELWHRWAERATEEHGDLVPIMWFVGSDASGHGGDIGAIAPFQAWDAERGGPLPRDFLADFTWPEAAATTAAERSTETRVNWLTLPVTGAGFPVARGVSGFISEALGGWKPSPLQPTMSVSALDRAAGLSPA